MSDSDLHARLDAYIVAHLDGWIAQLAMLCAQPSASATGEGIPESAELVADMLGRCGIATEVLRTAGKSVVYGEAAGAGGGAREVRRLDDRHVGHRAER